MAKQQLRYRFSPTAMAGIAKVRLTLEPLSAYDDRAGYDEDFLGAGFKVPLPTLGRKADALPVKGGGKHLHYHNFTTAQSKSRRVPLFSAVNVNGKRSKKATRSNVWHYDPRIPTKYQIIEECYGNAADDLFSRGHMTRREDPVWGAKAKQAEVDTFAVTNAAPQMQAHNSPVWLGLEDYVLQNARNAGQLACVFTGPVLRKSDPVIHQVKIPTQFWKVLAFIHDDTGALASVAYLDSQADYLPGAQPAFVWGQYKGMQVPVKRVETLTGLKFPGLAAADVLAAAPASFAYSPGRANELIIR